MHEQDPNDKYKCSPLELWLALLIIIFAFVFLFGV